MEGEPARPEVNAPEARTSQNPTAVSANPLFLGSLWFKLRRSNRGRRMTGEVIWRSKLRCRERGQVQVARSSPTPPTSKIYYSFHTVSHVDPVWRKKKKKKKKRGAKKCTPWRLCRTTWLVIRRFISGRVRSERDGLIAFRISLTSFTNSRLLLVCGHGKKWKIELVPGVRRRWARRWIFSNASFDATFSFNWPVWWRWKYSSRNDVFKILVDDIATFLPSYI